MTDMYGLNLEMKTKRGEVIWVVTMECIVAGTGEVKRIDPGVLRVMARDKKEAVILAMAHYWDESLEGRGLIPDFTAKVCRQKKEFKK